MVGFQVYLTTGLEEGGVDFLLAFVAGTGVAFVDLVRCGDVFGQSELEDTVTDLGRNTAVVEGRSFLRVCEVWFVLDGCSFGFGMALDVVLFWYLGRTNWSEITKSPSTASWSVVHG